MFIEARPHGVVLYDGTLHRVSLTEARPMATDSIYSSLRFPGVVFCLFVTSKVCDVRQCFRDPVRPKKYTRKYMSFA